MLDSLTHVGKCHERLNLSLSDGLHHSPGYDVTGEVVDDSANDSINEIRECDIRQNYSKGRQISL